MDALQYQVLRAVVFRAVKAMELKMGTWRIGSFGAGIAISVCLIVAGFVGWLIGAQSHVGQATAQAQTNLPVLWRAPDYRLTNQFGKIVSSTAFEGKVRVVTFLDPYCDDVCPLIAAHMVGLEHLLRAARLQDQVELVAFNVDPGSTGPRQMRTFLKQYGANPANPHWQYLTGEPKTIRQVVTGGFHVSYQKVMKSQEADGDTPESELTPQPEIVNLMAEKAAVNFDITHDDVLLVVDQQGRVRQLYDHADTVSIRRLLRIIERLLPGANPAGSRIAFQPQS